MNTTQYTFWSMHACWNRGAGRDNKRVKGRKVVNETEKRGQEHGEHNKPCAALLNASFYGDILLRTGDSELTGCESERVWLYV